MTLYFQACGLKKNCHRNTEAQKNAEKKSNLP